MRVAVTLAANVTGLNVTVPGLPGTSVFMPAEMLAGTVMVTVGEPLNLGSCDAKSNGTVHIGSPAMQEGMSVPRMFRNLTNVPLTGYGSCADDRCHGEIRTVAKARIVVQMRIFMLPPRSMSCRRSQRSVLGAEKARTETRILSESGYERP